MKINPKFKPADSLQDRRAEKGIIWLFCFVSVFGSVLVVYISRKRQLPSYSNDDSTMSLITSSGVLLTIGWINSIVGCLLVIYYNYISTPPSTNPVAFRKFWIQNYTQQQPEQFTNHPNRPPILVCFGDVLVRGSYSSNFVNHIPKLLSHMKYGNDTTKTGTEKNYNTFQMNDPIWVINAAENGYTSHVLVQEERIQKTYHAIFNMDPNDSTIGSKNRLPSHPNYVLLLTGTNDALCMTSSFIRDALETLHKPTGTILNIGNCTASTFQSNIYSLIRTIRSFPPNNNNTTDSSSSSPRSANKQNDTTIITEICICTIPPIGEEHTNNNKQSRMITSLYNQNVDKLNKVIEEIVTCDEFANDGHITIIPFHKECIKAIDKFQKQQQQQVSKVKQGSKKLPEPDLVLCHLINMVYHASLGSIPRTSTWLSSNDNAILLKDNMHLNENGRDIITQLVSDWIVQKEKENNDTTTKKNK